MADFLLKLYTVHTINVARCGSKRKNKPNIHEDNTKESRNKETCGIVLYVIVQGQKIGIRHLNQLTMKAWEKAV